MFVPALQDVGGSLCRSLSSLMILLSAIDQERTAALVSISSSGSCKTTEDLQCKASLSASLHLYTHARTHAGSKGRILPLLCTAERIEPSGHGQMGIGFLNKDHIQAADLTNILRKA